MGLMKDISSCTVSGFEKNSCIQCPITCIFFFPCNEDNLQLTVL